MFKKAKIIKRVLAGIFFSGSLGLMITAFILTAFNEWVVNTYIIMYALGSVCLACIALILFCLSVDV